MSGSFRLFVLITRCLLRTYLLRKAIIFDAYPPAPHEPPARARVHLPLPLANYLHLAGERIDLLRASGAGPGRGAGPSRRGPGPGLKCQCGQAGRGAPPPLTLSNSATSRPFALMQSGRQKANGGPRLGPKVGSGRKEAPIGCKRKGFPGRVLPRDCCSFVF